MLDYNEFYLYLIRHGQSEINAQPDMMGQQSDSQLTEKGRHQASLLRDRLRKEGITIDYVFSSTYDRALDTANIVVENKVPITINRDLREYSAGDWTGSSRHTTITVPVMLRMAAMSNGFLPPNGESIHMVERRATQWLEDKVLYSKSIMKDADDRSAAGKKPANIFVFSHGITIKSILHYIMGFDQSFTWKVTLDNTSISKLYFGKEGWRLLSINDCAHLFGCYV